MIVGQHADKHCRATSDPCSRISFCLRPLRQVLVVVMSISRQSAADRVDMPAKPRVSDIGSGEIPGRFLVGPGSHAYAPPRADRADETALWRPLELQCGLDLAKPRCKKMFRSGTEAGQQ